MWGQVFVFRVMILTTTLRGIFPQGNRMKGYVMGRKLDRGRESEREGRVRGTRREGVRRGIKNES